MYNIYMFSIIVFFILLIGLIALVIWGLRETWNDPGIDVKKFIKKCRENNESF